MSDPAPSSEVFGSYRIITRIATGGMAEVYAARKLGPDGKSTGSMVALKRLLPHLAHDPTIVRMFINEARITAQIHHPNVVNVLELGNQGNEPFIAMELLAGHSFGDLRQKAAHHGERVPLGITLKVLADACRGLDAAHRAQDENGQPLCIVHRDFTPDNIHVGIDGVVKVIDFGIAKAERLGAGTEPGTLKGKFFYMSPEMIAGRPVDHRADLYAAGVMLYEQLCGRRPFTGSTPDEVLHRIAEARPRRPTEFDPSVPPALEAICLMALKQDPNDRFQSLKEFITAIEQVGGSAGVASDEELGAYVVRLFPSDSDARLGAIARARALDPSGSRRRSTKLAAAQREDAPRRSGRTALIATLVVLLAGAGAGGFFAWTKYFPRLAPAERIAAAQATRDPGSRLAALEGLASDPSATPEQLTEGGALLLEAKAPQQALELSERFLQRFPDSAQARLIEARACIALRLGRRAESAIALASALEPKSAEPDLVLAELKALQADVTGATEALRSALTKKPASPKVAGRLGYLLSQAGKLDEAEEVLARALKRGFDPEAAAELAFVRYRQDRPSDAHALLRRALKEEPGFGRGHYYLGAVLFRQGDRNGAERAYLKAEKLLPDDPRPLLALCQLYALSARKNELTTLRGRIQAQFPDKAPVLLESCEAR